MYKLILADGTEPTGFTKNGDNYIRKEKVDESVFKDNLSTLEITDGEETITMHNAELIQQVEDADGFHICFRELSAQELQNKVTESNVTVPFPVSWTVKMKKKQKETQDILSYHSQAAGCSDKARAKASGGRQPIEECGRTGL